MYTTPGLLTSNNWPDSLKPVFYIVELEFLHKNELSSLSITKMTTHLKKMSDNTLKIKNKWQHTQNNVSAIAQKEWQKKSW
jgi:hypothetical protein